MLMMPVEMLGAPVKVAVYKKTQLRCAGFIRFMNALT